jgi:hypothetical protein
MLLAGNLFIYIGIGIIIDEDGYVAEETAMEHASSDNVSDAAEACNTKKQKGEAEVQKQEGSVSKSEAKCRVDDIEDVWIL